ncbi:hypothetical protein Egran_03210, partial [Elaphomyces granulatus]
MTSALMPTGKPSDKEYTERCLALKNPVISVYGTVVAIPIESGDRIFTLEVSTYLRREAGRNVFSNFEIHCVFPNNPRWENTFTPRVGRPIFIT